MLERLGYKRWMPISIDQLAVFVAGALAACAIAAPILWRMLRPDPLTGGKLATLTAENDFLKRQIAELKGESKARDEELAELHRRHAALEARSESEARIAKEKLELVEEAKTALTNQFKALAAESLTSNNERFMALAKSSFEKLREGARGDLDQRRQAIEAMLKPLENTLKALREETGRIEEKRHTAYGELSEQVKAMADAQRRLQGETQSLVRALRTPQGRGRWGEIQLRRIVEMAGLVNRVDFAEQASVATDTGSDRPDMIVNLPNGRHILVDAKTPLDAHLDAMNPELDDAARDAARQRHAGHVRTQIRNLGRKGYTQNYEGTVDFVVLFLPDEGCFTAALEVDPSLIESAWEDRVLIATPITLIALLRAVYFGWRQEDIAENARLVGEEARVLYERVKPLLGHVAKLGRSLGSSVGDYNRMVSSFDTRVLPSLRRLEELNVVGSGEAVGSATPVNESIRALTAEETPSIADGDDPSPPHALQDGAAHDPLQSGTIPD